MKQIFATAAFFFIVSFAVEALAQSEDCVWDVFGSIEEKNAFNNPGFRIRDAFTDNDGNYYLSVFFRDTIEIDGIVIAPDVYGDNLVCKYNKNGNFQWAKKKDVGADRFYAVVDKDNNIRAHGSSEDEDFIFLRKYDTDLNLISNQEIQRTGTPADIALDEDDNQFITFRQSGQDSLVFPDTVYQFPYYRQNNIVVVKYDAEGSYCWSRVFRHGIPAAPKLAVDTEGNAVLTGVYRDTLQVFDRQFTVENTANFFVMKLNGKGDLVWVNVYEGNRGDDPNDLVIDKHNNIYITGELRSKSVSFGDTIINLEFENRAKPFFVKLNSSGETVYVVKEEVSSFSSAFSRNIVINEEQNSLYIGGSFSGSSSMFGDQTVSGNPLHSSIYIARYSLLNGQFEQAYSTPSSCDGDVRTLSIQDGSIILSGLYDCGITFCDEMIGVDSPAVIYSRVFIARLNDDFSTATRAIEKPPNFFRIYPNPANDIIHLSSVLSNSFNSNARIEIFNLGGQKVFEEKFMLEPELSFDISNLINGYYIVKVSDGRVHQFLNLIIQNN